MSDRKHVVFVLPTLLPGGAERVLITLLNNLDPRKFEPHLVVFSDRGSLQNWVMPGIPVHSLGDVKARFALPPLLKKLNALSPDVIVSTMAATNFVVLLAKTFLKKKTRVIVREAVVPSSIIDSQKFPGVLKAAYKKLYPRADVVIAPAKAIIDEFSIVLNMDNSKYVLLHNPVDTGRILEKPVTPDTSDARKKTIHYTAAGRLHKQKGFDRLIAALPALKTPYDWKLTILGAGPEDEALKKMIAERNLGNKVFLAGLVKTPWPLYGAADAFLLPSRWEGLPNVVLESLACGTPVIAMAEAGGVNEIAALTSSSVMLAETMDDFLREMETIKPNPTSQYRPSLLPDQFKLETVMHEFTKLL